MARGAIDPASDADHSMDDGAGRAEHGREFP